MKKIIPVLLASLSLIPSAKAHCPLCTAAVGTGLIAARFYGVNDIVSGLWIGAFIISTALWADKVLRKRGKMILPLQSASLSLIAFILTVVPFFFAGFFNTGMLFLGIEWLLFGIIAGSIITYLAVFASLKLKKINSNAVLFPYQTIIFIMTFLITVSIVFWKFY